MQLTGKKIVVTGGASGLGEAAVYACVRAGAAVASLDLQGEAGARIVAQANAEGPGRAIYCQCDVTDRAGIGRALADAAADLGGITALVHFAGVDSLSPAESMTEEEWDRVLDINLKGTFLMNQAVFPYLRESGGAIVNVTSPVAFLAAPDRAHYAASKGGVASLTRALAAEWGQHGVRVVAISPVAYTAMTEAFRATLDPAEQSLFDARLRSNPLGRAGNPETDIAPVLVFLVSDAAKFITAQIIAIDGGTTPLR